VSESKNSSSLSIVGAIAFGILGAGLGDGGGFIAGAIIGAIWGAVVSFWLGWLGLSLEIVRRVCSAITTSTVIAVIATLIAVAAFKP
jgi:hypothetical protein